MSAMKRIISLLVFLIPLLHAPGCQLYGQTGDSGTNRAARLKMAMTDHSDDYVLVAAHRGFHASAPENSMAAMRAAIALGADIVEVDVQLSKDSVLVLMHDATINRTTNGRGKVSDYTFSELQKFHLRGKHGETTNEKIPSLRAILKEAVTHKSVLINIDKASRLFKEVAAVVHAEKAQEVVIVKSNINVPELLANAPYLSNSLIMPVIHLDKWDDAMDRVDWLIRELNPPIFEIVFQHDNSESFLRLLNAYTFNFWYTTTSAISTAGRNDAMAVKEGKKDESWGWLVNHRAKVIMSDQPDHLIAYLTSLGRRKLTPNDAKNDLKYGKLL